VARRQEYVGEFGGVVVIDDFAHHPTAVAGAIAAIRSRYPRHCLWAVFEPRSNTSRGAFIFLRRRARDGRRGDLAGVFRFDALAEDERLRPESVERVRAPGRRRAAWPRSTRSPSTSRATGPAVTWRW
jgi:UDP-N-acetylmuramate: L-alanyl-gamma-D-glutamyl-meso-diaminopimelate ligase